MTVNVRIVDNQAALNELLHSQNGQVARALLKRGLKVESAAKRRVKADHGRLRQSITHALVSDNGVVACRVGTDVKYAPYVHGGTGIYGPHHTPIRPVRASVLRFTSRRTGRVVYARTVRGQEPNPFLTDALKEP